MSVRSPASHDEGISALDRRIASCFASASSSEHPPRSQRRSGGPVGSPDRRPTSDAQFELVDFADWKLPLLDDPLLPGYGSYSRTLTEQWSAKIAAFDGFVFVTAEYNHSIPAALKNAIDLLYVEWNNKAAGFVGYGNTGGARAIEHLRAVMPSCQWPYPRSGRPLALHRFRGLQRVRPRGPARKRAHRRPRSGGQLGLRAGHTARRRLSQHQRPAYRHKCQHRTDPRICW